ncbi:glutamate receptor ionotropic, kainate 2-like [Cylas formicarius]|uniref:glutamate receptor ionotropic, kainate 2-like n=1 Tax=Cylas formicarius TaxID=197179 RepID=UPI0029588C06|nr:glutamate receptor ionotropic, kainate 2-like [Cylas formicarius]
MLKWAFVINLFFSCVWCQDSEYAIVGLFEDGEDPANEKAFNYAIEQVNEEWGTSRLSNLNYYLAPDDSFPAINLTCHLVTNSVVGIFGPKSLYNIYGVQSVCDAKEVPQILSRWIYDPLRSDNAVNFYPHASLLTQAYKDIITKWDWKAFTVLYEDDESLLRLSDLILTSKRENRVVNVEQLDKEGTGNYRPALKRIWKSQQKFIVLDCHIDHLVEVLTQCQQIGLITSDYNYLITNLDAHTKELSPFQYSETNITGIRIINTDSKRVQTVSMALFEDSFFPLEAASRLPTETALIYDAVMMYSKLLRDVEESEPPLGVPLDCYAPGSWKYGYTLMNLLKTASYKGLTGNIQFNQEGHRSSFGLQVYELREGGIIDVAYWNSSTGLNMTKNYSPPVVEDQDSMRNKTFIIVITLTDPYGMLKETSEQLVGNDRYEGFSMDLIHELSLLEGFNYTFTVQEDGANGKKVGERWTGMLGKVIYGEADMAITDLTITSERAKAVDFTSPFMTLGISILFQKPSKAPPNFFSFAEPFALDTWIALAVAFFVVSLSFFLLGRICPDEWTNPYPCIEEPEFLINQFSLTNSVWFATGAMLQQGSEIAPIAIPTRLVSGVWWFFVLIIVASYTANLASFLVTENNLELFTDVQSLVEKAEEHKIRYGAKANGATFDFFDKSEGNELYKKIAKHMKDHPEDMPTDNKIGIEMAESMRYAFFMESISIEYTTQRHCDLNMVGDRLDEKGYGIALRKNSPYRTRLSTAILKLQSSGVIDKIRKKWWEERKGGGQCTGDAEETEATPLDLQNVEGVFYVTVFGTIMGATLVFFEYGFSILRISKKAKITFREALKQELKFFVKFSSNVKPVIGSGSEEDDEKLHEESQPKSESNKSKTKSETPKTTITDNGHERPYGFVVPRSHGEYP